MNGITGYFLTKLDVLSGLEKVPVCVAYEVDGKRQDEIPMTQTEFHHAVPVYEYFDGWAEDISKARTFDDLPPNARTYIRAVEEMIGAPVSAVGVGPRRDQTLQLRPLLRALTARPCAGRLTACAFSSSGPGAASTRSSGP